MSIQSIRKDWELIQNLIEEKRKVLDIGCGDGGLIFKLKKENQSITKGLEIEGHLVRDAISKGLVVVEGDAEKDLNQYNDETFDYVILSQTLQAMNNPKSVIEEMLRIGGKVIVSFPNFGHWKIRTQLLIKGKMPITKNLPYNWYDTPNIHFFPLKDFQQMCFKSDIVIEKSIGLTETGVQFNISNFLFANLYTYEAIFLLSKKKFETIKLKNKQKILAGSRVKVV